jgi:hypothetical protein
MRHAVLTVAVLTLFAGAAPAQTYSPPSSGPSIGFRAYGGVDATSMAARDSFDAAFGTSMVSGAGGGAEVDIWKHLFVRVAATHAKKTGSRVFVDAGQVFDLNIPMTVTMTPLEVGGGWRFISRSRFAPYVGAAFVSLAYDEVSDFAGTGDNVSERLKGAQVFAGVDVGVWKGIFVGVEGRFRSVHAPSDPLSLMNEFSEDDLGGAGAMVRFGFSTK